MGAVNQGGGEAKRKNGGEEVAHWRHCAWEKNRQR
jgi:hypothetical protein